jgi:hypothetical protein
MKISDFFAYDPIPQQDSSTKETPLKFMRKRLTYANVMSSVAVFLILGGATAIAAKQLGTHTVGVKQLKANAVTTAKIKKEAVTTKKLKKNAVNGSKVKDGSLTGADINLSTLGTVPSATNATNVNTVKPFSAGADDDQLVSLVKTANFELMGICDPNGDFDPPGVQFENTGTAYVIYNRSTVPAYADSEDDEDANLSLNQGVVFNYDDNTDGGEAMATDGHFLAAPSWANEQADINDVNSPAAEDDYPFPTACHFAGSALVG